MVVRNLPEGSLARLVHVLGRMQVTHSTRYTLHTLHSTHHTLHSTLYTLHSTLYIPHCTLYTLHSTLYTVHTPTVLYVPHSLDSGTFPRALSPASFTSSVACRSSDCLTFGDCLRLTVSDEPTVLD